MRPRTLFPLAALGVAGVAVAAIAAKRSRAFVAGAHTGTPPIEQPITPIGYFAEPEPFAMTQEAIIEAVRGGHLEYRWVDLPGAPGVQVFEDAGRIGGVRVPVSAETTAAIVDILTAALGVKVSPTTPLVEDLIYDGADIRVKPYAQNVANTAQAVPAFNASIERQIAKATSGRPGWGLVAGVGKSWVLSNLALEHPGRAINYGFHWPLSTPMGRDSKGQETGPWSSVDGKSKVFQQPSWAHNPSHVDYSQTLRLCRLEPGAVLPSHETLRTERLWI